MWIVTGVFRVISSFCHTCRFSVLARFCRFCRSCGSKILLKVHSAILCRTRTNDCLDTCVSQYWHLVPVSHCFSILAEFCRSFKYNKQLLVIQCWCLLQQLCLDLSYSAWYNSREPHQLPSCSISSIIMRKQCPSFSGSLLIVEVLAHLMSLGRIRLFRTSILEVELAPNIIFCFYRT